MKIVLEAKGIDKRFPGTHALKGVDFSLEAGEIHLLLGENGAGKSTFLKILAGAIPQDRGEMRFSGQSFSRLSPSLARRHGIAIVYQELSLVPYLTVMENIFLGELPRKRWGPIDWRAAFEGSQAILDAMGAVIDPRVEVAQLTLAERQLVEIARALSRSPRVLLLDEPTSALAEAEQERLFGVLARLRASGVAVVYTTHRLAETFRIGDRVTVFRDGMRVATLKVDEVAGEEELVKLMIGRELSKGRAAITPPRDEVLLRVENLRLPPQLHGVSFSLKAGEILGVFGVAGAGQVQLARALFGLAPTAQGQIFLDGRPLKLSSPLAAVKRGVGYVPRNRQDALLPVLPIPPNVTLAKVAQIPSFFAVHPAWEESRSRDYVERLRITPPDLERPVRNFSGGNQQKIVLARWLFNQAQLLVLDDPARGVDVGAREEMLKLFQQLAAQGAGILFVSSELRELLQIAHRILVLRQGQLAREFDHAHATEEAILKEALGAQGAPAATGGQA